MDKHTLIFTVAAIALVGLCSGQEVTCGDNQVYNSCGTACPNYCNRGSDLVTCTEQCVPGCECAPGYIRKYIDYNECIPQTSCKIVKRCPHNRAFYICGTACPKYCGQPDDVPCTDQCVPECQCKPGYVLRKKNSSNCILESKCPA